MELINNNNNNDEFVLETLSYVEQVAWFRKEYGFEPPVGVLQVCVDLGMVPKFTYPELTMLKKIARRPDSALAETRLSQFTNMVRMRLLGCVESCQGDAPNRPLVKPKASPKVKQEQKPGANLKSGTVVQTTTTTTTSSPGEEKKAEPIEDSDSASQTRSSKKKGKRGDSSALSELNTKGLTPSLYFDKTLDYDEVSEREIRSFSVIPEKDDTVGESSSTFATTMKDGVLRWNKTFLKGVSGLGGAALQSAVAIITPLFTKVQDFAVSMMSNVVLGVAAKWKDSIKSFIPELLEALCDVIVVGLVAYYGGVSVGLISLTGVLVRWLGLKRFSQIPKESLLVEEKQGEEGSVVWLLTVGTGIAVARLCGIEFDWKWLIGIALPLLAANRMAGLAGDAFSFIVGFLPKCVRAWIPPVLLKGSKADKVSMLICKMNELAGIGAKSYVYNQFIQCYEELKSLLPGLAPGVAANAMRALQAHAMFYTTCMREKGSSGVRIPAAWICLYGDKGIGKSSLVDGLIKELALSGVCKDLNDMEFVDMKYTRSQEDDYWSGYSGQPVVIIDDYLSQDELTNTRMEGSIMQMVTAQPYMLNMASMESGLIGVKGTCFTSRFLITTSNMFVNPNTKLSCPEALWRRKLLNWHVTVNQEVLNETTKAVDNDKVKAHAHTLGITYEQYQSYKPHLRFTLMNSFTASALMKPLMYQDMLKVTIARCQHFFRSSREMQVSKSFFGPKGLGIDKPMDRVHGGDDEDEGNKLDIADDLPGRLERLEEVKKDFSEEQIEALNTNGGKMLVAGGLYMDQNLEKIDEDRAMMNPVLRDSQFDDCLYNSDFETVDEHCNCCSPVFCDHCEKDCTKCNSYAKWSMIFYYYVSRVWPIQTEMHGYNVRISKSFDSDQRKCVDQYLKHGTLKHYDESKIKDDNLMAGSKGLDGTRGGFFRFNCKRGQWKGTCFMCVLLRLHQKHIGSMDNRLENYVKIAEIDYVSQNEVFLKPKRIREILDDLEPGLMGDQTFLDVLGFADDAKDMGGNAVKVRAIELVMDVLVFALGIWVATQGVKALGVMAGDVKEKLEPTFQRAAALAQENVISPMRNAVDRVVGGLNAVVESSKPEEVQGVYAGNIAAQKINTLGAPLIRETHQGDNSFVQNDAYTMAIGMVAYGRIFGLANGEEELVARGGVILLSSDKLLIPRHYVQAAMLAFDRFKFILERPGVSVDAETSCLSTGMKFSTESCVGKHKYDMVICSLLKAVPGVRNRAHLFFEEKHLSDVNTNGSYLVGYSPVKKDGGPVLWVNIIPGVRLVLATAAERILEAQGRSYMVDSWVYSGSSDIFMTGNCGALLVFPNASSNEKFGGFHRAAIAKEFEFATYYESQLVTREMLRKWINVVPQEVPQGITLQRSPKLVLDNEHLRVLGTYTKPVRLSEKSQFSKSPVHPDFSDVQLPWHPSVKEPAILTSNDPRHEQTASPLCIALRKYAPLKKEFSEEHLKISGEWMFQDFCEVKVEINPRVLTEDEAVNGIPGVEFIDGLAMDTSPGLPFVQFRPTGSTGKEFLFSGLAGSRFVSDKRLRNRLDDRLRIAKTGAIMDNSFWADSLKDEKLKLSKVAKSETRVFNVAPLDHLILAKRYFGYFAKWFQHAQPVLWGGIGINPASMQWTEMFDYLGANVGFKAHDGDWRFFDGRIDWTIYVVGLGVINRWYRTFDRTWKLEDDKVRESLLMEALWPMQVAFDVVYTKTVGMPSGWYLTAIINCLANYVLGVLFFIWAVNAKYEDWCKIRKKYYGDDNVYSYLIEFADRFNGEAMKSFYGDHGLLYTPADKSDVFGESKEVVKCEYLKRSTIFLEDVQIYLPIISKASIDEALNWVSTKSTNGDSWQALTINAVGVCDHLVFYGRRDYNLYREALLQASAACGKTLVVPSFEEIVLRLIERKDFPEKLVESKWYRENEFSVLERTQGDVAETASTESVSSVGTTITSNTGFSRADAGLGSIATPVVRIAESPIDYQTIVSKWQTLPPVSWSTSAPEGSILAAYNLPMEVIVNSQVQAVFDRSYLVRTDVDVMVRCAGTKFQQGILAVGFMPGVTEDQMIARLTLSKTAIANLPNVQYIFASGEQTQMRCPYTAKTSYIHTGANLTDSIKGTIGMFFVAVFTQLRVATGASTSANVIVSSKFSNCEFHFPKADPVEEFQGWDFAPLSRSAARIINIGKGCFDLARVVVDGLDTLSKLDHEVAPVRGIVTKERNVNLNNIDVPVDSDIMSLFSGGSAVAMPDHFCRNEDEMSVSYICEKPCYLDKVAWTVGDAQGLQKFTCPITPTMWMAKYASSLSNVQVTNIDYVAAMFARWRCDIVVEIVISATAFVSGSLRFSSILGFYTDAVDIGETTGQSFVSMDVSEGKRHFKMRIPYSSISSTKDVLIRPWSTIASGDAREQYAMGTWFLHVENALVVSGNVATTVDVEIFYHLENVSFFDLPPVMWIPTSIGVLKEIPQGDILVNAGDIKSVNVVENTVPISSLRDVVRKYGFFKYDTSQGTTGVYRYLYNMQEFLESGPVASIAQMYAGVRGGINLKVVYSSSTTYRADRSFFYLYDPTSNGKGSLTVGTGYSDGLPWAANGIVSSSGNMEITLPFSYKYNYVSTTAAIGTNGGSTAPIEDLNFGVVVFGTYNLESRLGSGRLIVYVGGGDDFRGGIFLGAPRASLVERN